MKRIRALYNLELVDSNNNVVRLGSETFVEAEKIVVYPKDIETGEVYCDLFLKDGTVIYGVVYSDIENHGTPEVNPVPNESLSSVSDVNVVESDVENEYYDRYEDTAQYYELNNDDINDKNF